MILFFIKFRLFFCAFCRKLISPKMAETHFTEGKTHFTDGKTHFTNSKTHVLKQKKNLAFSLVLPHLSSKVTNSFKIPKNWTCISILLGKFDEKVNIFVKIDQIGLEKGKNSFPKVPKLISQMPKTHFFGILREWP